jgi:MFS superfamily sulfate permease-like transporter
LLYQSDPPARVAVIDCEMMADMDMTGAARLAELVSELRDHDVDVRLARLHGSAHDVADRAGVLVEVGDDHVQLTVAQAVREAQAELTD